MMIHRRFAYWVIGLGVGAWIGSHPTGDSVTTLDWVVIAALGILTVLALLFGFERREVER